MDFLVRHYILKAVDIVIRAGVVLEVKGDAIEFQISHSMTFQSLLELLPLALPNLWQLFIKKLFFLQLMLKSLLCILIHLLFFWCQIFLFFQSVLGCCVGLLFVVECMAFWF